MKLFLNAVSLVLLSGSAHAGGDFSSSTLFHAINFAILVGLLIKFAGPKIREAMESRSESISEEITQAETQLSDAQRALAAFETKLESLGQDAEKMLDEYRLLGERERDRIIDDARKEAKRIVSEANLLATREVAAARTAIERDVLESAMTKAEVEIQRRLTADDRQRLISDYLVGLERVLGSDIKQEVK